MTKSPPKSTAKNGCDGTAPPHGRVKRRPTHAIITAFPNTAATQSAAAKNGSSTTPTTVKASRTNATGESSTANTDAKIDPPGRVSNVIVHLSSARGNSSASRR